MKKSPIPLSCENLTNKLDVMIEILFNTFATDITKPVDKNCKYRINLLVKLIDMRKPVKGFACKSSEAETLKDLLKGKIQL